jgi:hypothetical protein
MRLFGFEIKREDDDITNQPVSFAEPLNDDGALTVGGAVGGSYGMLLDLEGSAKSEAELVTRYRSLTVNPEIQQAVDEIVNEAISIDSHDKVVNVILDDVKVPDKVKEKIRSQIYLAKNISKLSYEVAINDVIEDLKSEADSPKKLNIKHKNDPSSEYYEAFVVRKLGDNELFIQVLESFLETLKN